MSPWSCHDLEHGQQVLSIAAHGTSAEVLLMPARGRRVLVLVGHHTCRTQLKLKCEGVLEKNCFVFLASRTRSGFMAKYSVEETGHADAAPDV